MSYMSSCALGRPQADCPLRISSDYNPLHIDPSIGSKLGFGGTILHGLCSYGIAARAIVKHVAGGDGTRLLEMGESGPAPGIVPLDQRTTLTRSKWQAVASRVPSSLDRRSSPSSGRSPPKTARVTLRSSLRSRSRRLASGALLAALL